MWPWIFGTVSVLVGGGVTVTGIGFWFARHLHQAERDLSHEELCHWVHKSFDSRCELEILHEGPHRVNGKWYPQDGAK